MVKFLSMYFPMDGIKRTVWNFWAGARKCWYEVDVFFLLPLTKFLFTCFLLFCCCIPFSARISMKFISLVTRRLRVVMIMKSLHTKGIASFPCIALYGSCYCWLLTIVQISANIVNFPIRSSFFKIRTIGHTVTSPEDTREQCTKLFMSNWKIGTTIGGL